MSRERTSGALTVGARWRCLVGLAAVLLPGCGPSGAGRYDVSGAVTYDGQPVPAGLVIFEPDASKGNTGPASYATIQQGRYATQPGEGAVGGPILVRIMGRDGDPSSETPQGRMLFPREYQTNINLPQENTTHDFDVPPMNP